MQLCIQKPVKTLYLSAPRKQRPKKGGGRTMSAPVWWCQTCAVTLLPIFFTYYPKFGFSATACDGQNKTTIMPLIEYVLKATL
jgi:hypothetical protein